MFFEFASRQLRARTIESDRNFSKLNYCLHHVIHVKICKGKNPQVKILTVYTPYFEVLIGASRWHKKALSWADAVTVAVITSRTLSARTHQLHLRRNGKNKTNFTISLINRLNGQLTEKILIIIGVCGGGLSGGLSPAAPQMLTHLQFCSW